MSRDELLTVHAFDQNNDGMVNEDEVNFYLSGNESYDQETFLNTGWLLMKNLFSKYEKRPAKNNSKFPFHYFRIKYQSGWENDLAKLKYH